MTDTEIKIPPGYNYEPSTSAFVNHVGPMFHKIVVPPGGGPKEHWSAMWIKEHHVNTWGLGHGGFMAFMAEAAINGPAYEPGGPPAVIVQMSLTFIGPPKLGGLFEVCGTLIKATRTMFFTEGRGMVGKDIVFSATGIVKAVPAKS